MSLYDSIQQTRLKCGSIETMKLNIDDEDTIQKLKQRYIAFDVETTGFHSTKDKIIEVGAALFENGKIIKRYGNLVNAKVLIPYSATAVNHITNDMIENAPDEHTVYAELVEFLGDALHKGTVICAHNAPFDMKFLSATLARLGYVGKIHYVDTLTLSRNFIYGLENYKQDTVARYFNIVNNQAHRAVSDAITCGSILWNLLQIIQEYEFG